MMKVLSWHIISIWDNKRIVRIPYRDKEVAERLTEKLNLEGELKTPREQFYCQVGRETLIEFPVTSVSVSCSERKISGQTDEEDYWYKKFVDIDVTTFVDIGYGEIRNFQERYVTHRYKGEIRILGPYGSEQQKSYKFDQFVDFSKKRWPSHWGEVISRIIR